MTDAKANAIRDKLIVPVATAVLLGWLGSLGFAVMTNEYTPLTVVTPVMLLLAGFVFGTGLVRSATRDKNDGS